MGTLFKNNQLTVGFLLSAPFLPVLLTVWVMNGDLVNGVVSGKYFWFYASMGLVAMATLMVALISNNRFRVSMIDGLILLFAGSVYCSALLINNASQNTTKLMLFALLPVLYCCFRLVGASCRCGPDLQSDERSGATVGLSHIKRGISQWDVMTFVFILTGFVEAVWGLRQLYGFSPSQHGLFRLTGSFFNPGPYAGYLAMVFPLALHWGMQTARNTLLHASLKWFGIITCFVILLVLPAAMSRASWLAVMGGSLIVVVGKYSGLWRRVPFILKTKRSRPLKVLIVSGLILLVLAALTGMYSLKKNSADGRALTWKISIQTIIKHPFGVGLGHFSNAYGETQAAYFASGKASKTEEYVAGSPEYGFNEYLQIAVESGMIALLLFAGIIVLAVRNMIKANDWGRLGSLVALLVFAGFSYPFGILPFLIVFVFLLAVGQWSADEADRTDLCRVLNNDHLLKKKKRIRPHSIVLALCCLLISVGCLWKQYPVYQAYRQWKDLQTYYQAGMFEYTIEAYEALYPLLNDQTPFLFEYAQSLSKTGLDNKQRLEAPARCESLLNKSNEVLRRAMQTSCDPMLYNVMGKNYQAMKAYSEAEACYIRASGIIPSRLYPWYLLTKLYDEMGLKEKVHETANMVLSKEPKVQSPAIGEMREEVRKLTLKNR